MSGKTQIDIVHVLGWMENLSRTLVIRREIGRFKNRETKPSWGLLIRSVFSSSFDMSCSAVLQCRCPNIHNRWRQRGAGKSSIGSMYFGQRKRNFTIGKLIDELKAFERFVRLVGRTAEYLRLDSRARAYPRHCGRSLQTDRLAGSRHGCHSPGTRGLGSVGRPNSPCTPLDSTRLLLCLGRSLLGGLGTSLVA
jgi:hypothetical protein